MEVRRNAYKLWKELGEIFYHPDFRNYWFQDQIMRAVISITNNIAEWSNRSSAKDFAKFLFISKWSCAEVQSMLYFAQDFGYISLEQQVNFIDQTKSIINQLGKFITYLRSKS